MLIFIIDAQHTTEYLNHEHNLFHRIHLTINQLLDQEFSIFHIKNYVTANVILANFTISILFLSHDEDEFL